LDVTGSRQVRLNGRESSRYGIPGRLFLLQHAGQHVDASREFRNGPISILETSLHFAFAQGQHVRSQI
jgi:hypothetical protein